NLKTVSVFTPQVGTPQSRVNQTWQPPNRPRMVPTSRSLTTRWRAMLCWEQRTPSSAIFKTSVRCRCSAEREKSAWRAGSRKARTKSSKRRSHHFSRFAARLKSAKRFPAVLYACATWLTCRSLHQESILTTKRFCERSFVPERENSEAWKKIARPKPRDWQLGASEAN